MNPATGPTVIERGEASRLLPFLQTTKLETVVLMALAVCLFPVTCNAQDSPAKSNTDSGKMAPIEFVATTPDIRYKHDAPDLPDEGWLRMHQKRIDAGKAMENIDLIMLGDSITSGIGSAGKTAFYEDVFKDLDLHNLGYGGDRVEHVLWRLKNGAVDGLSPKVVMVMIGTNNAGTSRSLETALGVHAIVEELQTRLPETQILLLDIFPNGKGENDWRRRKNKEVNRILQNLAQGKEAAKNLHQLSINETFLSADGETLNTEYFMRDRLHLTPEGYAAWAKAVEPKVRELRQLADVSKVR